MQTINFCFESTALSFCFKFCQILGLFSLFEPFGVFFLPVGAIFGVEVRLENIFGTYKCRLSTFVLEVQPYLFDFDLATFGASCNFGPICWISKSTKMKYQKIIQNFYFILSLSSKQTFKKSKEQLLISELGESGRGSQLNLGNNSICFVLML